MQRVLSGHRALGLLRPAPGARQRPQRCGAAHDTWNGAHGWVRAARIGSFARLTRRVGRTWSGSSSRGGARSTAGAWCGGRCRGTGAESRARRRRRWRSVFAQGGRWGSWATLAASPWRGARLRRGRRTATWAGRGTRRESDDAVWSVVCFFVSRSRRGEGLAHRLLEAAVAYAAARGARVVEAYPVAPDSPSYRFMGLTSWFEAAGFRRVGTAGSRRHVMRLAL